MDGVAIGREGPAAQRVEREGRCAAQRALSEGETVALLAVKHLDPVVGVDVHSVLVTPGTPPVFLPHPHVGFMLDKREYIQAAKAVVGCIATMIAQEKLTEYIEHHPEDVTKLEHLREHGSAGAADGPEADTWVRDGEHGGYYYAFDRIGNLVRKRNALQDLRLRWDGDGLLIETVMERRASAEVGGASGTLCIHTRYAYDVFHRRTRKDTRIECGVDTWAIGSSDSTVLSRNSSFFWDGDALIGEALRSDRQANRLLSDLAGAANTTRPLSSGRHATAPVHAATVSMDSYGEAREWVYYPGTFRPLAGMRCAYAMDTTAPQFVVCHGQATRLPVSRSEPAEPYFFHNDPNGAPTTIIGARGSIVWEGSYSAWGWVSLHGDRDEFEQPLRFQGQQHDDETGLHYNRNRYYDCDAGRFISLDPIGLRAGNIETYAPNAITWIDPLGLAKQQLTKDDAVLRLYAERDQMERNQMFKGKQGGTVIAGVINRETEEMEFGERGWTGMPHFLQTYRMQDLTRFPNGSRVAGTNILGCAESPAFAVLLATDANILPGYEPLADLGHYTSFAWTRTGNGTWVPKRACLNCVGLYGDAHLASGIDG
ncbi:RHS repeat-associated core domain-containing protein [Burkholderia sp. Ac-20392]|uniref:RHS repeat-associated core domain-containing protein n=1 Tax=Burkholderia sp. Ac-20392 TaxID=2703905 RepID=UPI00197EA67A|nr:RHS repeat-associated core domain-containing protein [Burkholderia sp. Ac-20392]MBN3794362.1 hypothetical protein [Burkholderia sp. Ac-20392]